MKVLPPLMTMAGLRRSVVRAWYANVVFGEVMWTEDSEAHIARHGIQPAEVEQALYGRPRLRTTGRDGTALVLGTSNEGRHLLVVVSQAADGRDFIVTAREMTNNEKRLFREKGQ